MFEKKTHNGKEYNQSTKANGWKIVHKEDKIIHLDCSVASVGSMDSVYFTPNFRSMMQYIKTNNLDVNSIELNDYDYYFDLVVDGAIMPNDTDLIEFLDTFTFID
tara:strand:- start:549 stop:863 length:315 start_codon:yes stop_codon:yes gene_type:complete